MQLARTHGALAGNSLHAYYLSSNLMPEPIVGFIKGHWLIMLTSVAYFAVGILAPLASESIFNDTNYHCPNPDPERPQNPCWPPRLTADPIAIRTLQGLLALIAVMTLGIMVTMYRSPSGIYTDPSSIATVASLMHHPEVLDDFQRVGMKARRKDMKKQLGNKRYRIQNYQSPDGAWRYGIVAVAPDMSSNWQGINPYPPVRQSSHASRLRKI